MYLEKNITKDKLEYKYKGIEELNKKIKKGDKIGKVEVISNNKVIYTYDVYLDSDIKYYNYLLYISIILLLILLIIIIKKLMKRKKYINKC